MSEIEATTPEPTATSAIDIGAIGGAVGQHVYRALPAVDRAEAIVNRLRGSISLGVLRPGDRLPSEAEMSESFGVSPATLRDALAQLRDAGLVETRRGRNGGTFVVDTPEPARAEVERKLAAYSVAELRDIGDQRSAISGMSARLAAARSSERDAARLTRLAQAVGAADSPGSRTRAHSRFWLELAVAAQSQRLLASELQLQLEIGDLLWTPLTHPLDHAQVAESLTEIASAVATHDAEAASSRVKERIRLDSFHLIDEKLTLALGQPEKGLNS
ncbi:FadR family transcriptional regulator [Gulosibacter macacae]|uniref:FadR family transcriptional regulator n=1 Tax=Gulosibacter macacae TaxID=2488791 RepID=A0A3P3VZF0_9MICO|nr:GntR family transcriptional regulator [Gulosibacter macacae]RRJ87617.1 FadR family transcriptional regulator [Gulosibacter macacae]